MEHDEPRQESSNQDGREPYEAPAIEETATFETLALACNFGSPFSGCNDPQFS